MNAIDDGPQTPTAYQLAASGIAKHPEMERRIKAALSMVGDPGLRPRPVEPPAVRYWFAWSRHGRDTHDVHLVDTIGQSCSCAENLAHRRGSHMGTVWCVHRLAVAMLMIIDGETCPATAARIPAEVEQAHHIINTARARSMFGVAHVTG